MEAARNEKKRVLLPFAFWGMLSELGNESASLARIVCDYIAGMTEKQTVSVYRVSP